MAAVTPKTLLGVKEFDGKQRRLAAPGALATTPLCGPRRRGSGKQAAWGAGVRGRP